jgi:hypothetical protein
VVRGFHIPRFSGIVEESLQHNRYGFTLLFGRLDSRCIPFLMYIIRSIYEQDMNHAFCVLYSPVDGRVSLGTNVKSANSTFGWLSVNREIRETIQTLTNSLLLNELARGLSVSKLEVAITFTKRLLSDLLVQQRAGDFLDSDPGNCLSGRRCASTRQVFVYEPARPLLAPRLTAEHVC